MDIKPITTYQGKIVPLFYDNIDTDQIIPKVHLKRISKLDLAHSLLMNGVIYQTEAIIQTLIQTNLNIKELVF